MESANPQSLVRQMHDLGVPDADIQRAFRNYSAWAWQFRQAGDEAERLAASRNEVIT
jgi:hypothetical protein